jgi:putative ABC transport system permease protein
MQRWPQMWVIAEGRSPEVSAEAQAELKFFLRRTRRIPLGEPDNFRIDAVQEYLDKFREMSLVITVIATGVVGISLLVGGVGIMNIMLVSVTERTREIGLRMAVGARRLDILTQFLIEALTLSIAGGVIGVAAGLLTAKQLASQFNWPLLIRPQVMMIAVGFSAVVGIGFGLYPARKASRLDPIEALRFE